jgi:hypothetical protein
VDIGGDNGDHSYYALGSNAWTTITLTGANASDVARASEGAMIYVDALDAFLVRLQPAGGTVYQINASTFEVTTFPTTGGSSIPPTFNGPHNKFLYVPNLGGAIYVPCYSVDVANYGCTSGNAWFLRLRQ